MLKQIQKIDDLTILNFKWSLNKTNAVWLYGDEVRLYIPLRCRLRFEILSS